MTCHEVGVKVRQDDVLDRQVVLLGENKVLIDVALRVDDRGHADLLVTDKIGSVRQAIEIELLQDHADRPHPVGSGICIVAGT